jgi:osmoprotectant transport system permease protein
VRRLAILALALACGAGQAETLKVGSKRFTESYILGEILVQAAGDAVHRPGLGNTGIVFAALKAG